MLAASCCCAVCVSAWCGGAWRLGLAWIGLRGVWALFDLIGVGFGCLWMLSVFVWVVCLDGLSLAWLGLGPCVLEVCGDWLGCPAVCWGACWLLWACEEPESLILAQSERWRHA